MRVAAVRITGHPGLGDMDVDLRGADGRAARLVVVAGENGCGKTALMEAIFAALTPSSAYAGVPILPHFKRAIGKTTVVLSPDTACLNLNLFTASADGTPPPDAPGRDGLPDLVVELDPQPGPIVTSAAIGSLLQDGTLRRPPNNSLDFFQLVGMRRVCFYSEANVTFAVPAIDAVRTSAGTEPGTPSGGMDPTHVRGGEALGARVAQLFVDLEAADNADLARWTRRNPGQPAPVAEVGRRMRRFADAFRRMFPSKRLVEVEQMGNACHAIFEEHGRRTTLAELSTGEKQIVFRGAFLLRRLEDLPGAVVLIDEPELSLHPNWQSRILDFYDAIVAETPERPSQIILATHSPFVVHGSPTAKHVVLRRDRATGAVGVNPKPSYPGVTPADVAVAAFDLSGFVRDARGKRLALIVEGPTDRTILEEAWRKLRGPQAMPFTTRSADGANNIPRLLGATGGKSGPLLDALADSGTVLVGLFDFDHQGYGQWNGTVTPADAEAVAGITTLCQVRKRCGAPIWAALLPVPEFRKGYAGPKLGGDSQLTIELLFPDSCVGTLLERVAVAGDGGATRLAARSDAQKKAVAAAAVGFPPEAFAAFEPIFTLLDRIAGHAGLAAAAQ